MRYDINVSEIIFSIESRACSTQPKEIPSGIFLQSQGAECNMLSDVTETGSNSHKTISLWWETHNSADYLGLLYVPETRVLFIGSGALSARVDWARLELLGTEDTMLFWCYERIGQFIIEYGEVDCYLYTLNGEKLAHASVDPPYKVEKLATRIRFTSEVHGTTELMYPVK